MNLRAAVGLLLVIAATASCASRDSPGASYGMAGGITLNPAIAPSRPAPMDRTRKISEQDCSKPVTFDQGNLRCR